MESNNVWIVVLVVFLLHQKKNHLQYLPGVAAFEVDSSTIVHEMAQP